MLIFYYHFPIFRGKRFIVFVPMRIYRLFPLFLIAQFVMINISYAGYTSTAREFFVENKTFVDTVWTQSVDVQTHTTKNIGISITILANNTIKDKHDKQNNDTKTIETTNIQTWIVDDKNF